MSNFLKIEFNDKGIYVTDGNEKVSIEDLYNAWKMNIVKKSFTNHSLTLVEVNYENGRYSSAHKKQPANAVVPISGNNALEIEERVQYH